MLLAIFKHTIKIGFDEPEIDFFLRMRQQKLCYIVQESHRGAQPALHFGGGNFMNFHSMTSSCLFKRGTTFSQTVTDMFFSQRFRK